MYQALLARLAGALDGAAIEYMVIGGQAVLVHGEPRLTRDIDITLGVDSSELGRVQQALTKTGLQSAVDDLVSFVKQTNVLPLLDERSRIHVDLIFSFTQYEREAIRRAVLIQLENVPVRFAEVEDLLIHKLVAGRPRDLEDIRGVLARRPKLDRSYLKKWLDGFSDVVGRDLGNQLQSIESSLDLNRPLSKP